MQYNRFACLFNKIFSRVYSYVYCVACLFLLIHKYIRELFSRTFQLKVLIK